MNSTELPHTLLYFANVAVHTNYQYQILFPPGMWDRILSDTDGPYLELVVGAYSDNQPDHSWIQLHEVKTFKQHWYHFQKTGGVKNANADAAVNLEVKHGQVLTAFPRNPSICECGCETDRQGP